MVQHAYMDYVSGASVSLLKGMEKAVEKQIYIEANYTGKDLRPPTGKHWLLIGALIEHVTGTASVFSVKSDKSMILEFARVHANFPTSNVVVGAGIAIDPTAATIVPLIQSSIPPFTVLCDSEYFLFAGDNTAFMHVKVLEW